LYLAFAAAEAIADNKVAGDILWAGRSGRRWQLFYVTSFRAAIVNYDAVPSAQRLRRFRKNHFFDRFKTVIAGQTKCTGGGRVVAKSYQN
jgi:hypothetical protein